ncbi:hypothetical protein HG535_0B01610 [Zygotorulaspora mrakii]|uniref:Major facilitator superfamily (MFS) profile domain-containing protein n=1 Tax=Zygotorulaspora mrakii TaxID=42260 RepID=A0A7H9AXY7_ZYGMR|nr:uncharacterized protein HG535_0B01610 [Zygotorulaspora mrakii]QLG71123.1 hypothetical protein HG535_0B01610 [Zygotorulaspora mrakii]
MSENDSLLYPSRGVARNERIAFPVIYCTLIVCLGSAQFGYHTAELNAPQQFMSCSEFSVPNGNENVPYDSTWLGRHHFRQCVPMDDEQIGLVTAMFCVGGLFGSYYAGWLANVYGRKKVCIYGCVLSGLGSLMLFASNSYSGLILGRILVGISSGICIVVIPLFINEISPVEWRGSLGSLNQVCINMGILFTQSLALKFADSYRWRWLLFTGFLLAVVNIVLLFIILESPKWLMIRGRLREAEMSLYKLRNGSLEDAKAEIQKWRTDAQHQEDQENLDGNKEGPTLWQYVRNPMFRKPRNVILALLLGQQLCGINSIIFYGVKVISQLLPDHAIQVNLGISLVNVLVTLAASALIAVSGCKPLLMFSAGLMSISSFLISIGIVKRMATLLVSSTFLYITAFALGLGPIPFMIIGSLSAPQDAATAQSFGTVCNWLGTFFIAYLFPMVHDLVGGSVYCIFGFIAVGFCFYTYYYIPETKNKASYTDVWSGY